jgi:hypothetical protein
MVILFGAGHVLGEKIWMGYNEDLSMFDLAKREAKYAAEKYGQQTKTFYVTHTSYPAVEDACRGCDLAIFEHSNAEAAPVKGTANRVTIYRTVKKPGDGVCLEIAKVTAKILNTVAYPVQHAANSQGNDAYGALGRAMRAGCSDTWLAENGFHTHPATRELLSLPEVRQEIAEAKVDVMAQYYGWESDTMQKGSRGSDVTLWQKRLIEWNPDALPRFGADGDFGGETEDWTKQFQTAAGLDATGIVGAAEWNAMCGDSAKVEKLEAQLTDAQNAKLITENQLAQADLILERIRDAAQVFREI